jgi:hypothetical protein
VGFHHSIGKLKTFRSDLLLLVQPESNMRGNLGAFRWRVSHHSIGEVKTFRFLIQLEFNMRGAMGILKWRALFVSLVLDPVSPKQLYFMD